MLRTRTVLAIAVASGCSFDSFENGRTETLGATPDDEEMMETRPGASGTRGAADGDGGAEGSGGESGAPPETSGLGPATDDGGRVDLGSPGGTGGTIDCGLSQTFERSIEDAEVVSPMESAQIQGVGLVAFSTVSDSGEVEFTFDIACEGVYYVHAYVADLWAGVHSYDDPDSYVMTSPAGEATWFYGCQTGDLDGKWHWLPVTNGVAGQACEEAMQPMLSLPVGTHTIRFRNREPVTWDDRVAAIARVIVTNDGEFLP